jgi:hypothetical protein
MPNDRGLTFGVSVPRIAWWETLLSGALNAGSSAPMVATKARWITVVNRRGWTRAVDELPRTASDDWIEERILEIERDLDLLSLPAWCERYGVPMLFVEAEVDDAGAPEPEPSTTAGVPSVEYDLHNWAPVDILNALAQMKDQCIE